MDNVGDTVGAVVGTAFGIWVGIFVIALAFFVWNIVLIVRYWSDFTEWAKVLYIVLLLSGIGPLPSIILIYSGVGFKRRVFY